MRILSFFLLILLSFGCENKQTFYLITDNAGGLQNGAKLMISGLIVGEIESFDIASTTQVIAKASVEEKFNIPRGSKFSIISADFLGTKAVDIDFGKGSDFLSSQDTIELWPEKNLVLDSTLIQLTNDFINQVTYENKLDSLLEQLDEIDEKLKIKTK